MGEREKLKVLAKIAREFNGQKITWALGASLLLYLKGVVTSFNDIDIMVSEEDAQRAKQILLEMGSLQPANSNVKYRTKVFLEFIVGGVDVDVMAGFSIVRYEKEYYFPLRESGIKEWQTVEGEAVPLQSLEEWRNYYELMGRTEKVEMIDRKTGEL